MRKHKLKRLMTVVSDWEGGGGGEPHTEPGRRQDKSAAGVLFCELSIYTAGCCLFPTGFWVKRVQIGLLPSFPHPSLLIQPKHLTKEVRWRSPGSVGDQSRFSENKRSLEDGKADVTRRGRLALKT